LPPIGYGAERAAIARRGAGGSISSVSNSDGIASLINGSSGRFPVLGTKVACLEFCDQSLRYVFADFLALRRLKPVMKTLSKIPLRKKPNAAIVLVLQQNKRKWIM
jgi:hypothetical protein